MSASTIEIDPQIESLERQRIELLKSVEQIDAKLRFLRGGRGLEGCESCCGRKTKDIKSGGVKVQVACSCTNPTV